MDIVVYVSPGTEHAPSLIVRAIRRLQQGHEVYACAFLPEVESVLRRAGDRQVYFLLGGCASSGRNFVANDPVWSLLRQDQCVGRPIIVFDYFQDSDGREAVRELELANVPRDMMGQVRFVHLNDHETFAQEVLDAFCGK